MIATGKRNIKKGDQYDHLFSRAKGEFITVKQSASLDDTLGLMQKVVCETLADTKKIAHHLEADTAFQTCQQIWAFCYHHIQYERDEQGIEQVRRPSRSWQDRRQGIDCDCFSVFIGSILINLGIPFIWRITKYQSQEFEHIYPVAIVENRSIIMDCVVNQFNYEVPYTEKKDIKMKLQELNGIPEDKESEDYIMLMDSDLPIDAMDLFSGDLEGLEGRAERRARRAKRKAKRATKKEARIAKKGTGKERRKRFLNKFNRINPGMALLRAGLLASMKLNVMKVASRLRFSYWSIEQARANNMNLNTYNGLKRVRKKLEDIFYKAGGKPENFKKSILTGRGNRNRQVQLNGLGSIIEFPDDNDSLETILGGDLMFDELMELEEGLDGFGAVATGAAVASASGVLATISKLIKKLGTIFKAGSKAGKLLKSQTAIENGEEKTRRFSFKNIANKVKGIIQKRKGRKELKEAGIEPPVELVEEVGEEFVTNLDIPNSSEMVSRQTETATSETPPTKKGAMDWIKDNKLLTAGIGLVLGTGVVLAIKAKSKKSLNGLAGTKKKKKMVKRKTVRAKKPTPKKKPTTPPPKKRRKRRTPKVKVELLK